MATVRVVEISVDVVTMDVERLVEECKGVVTMGFLRVVTRVVSGCCRDSERMLRIL
jgi:hypothetical protein